MRHLAFTLLLPAALMTGCSLSGYGENQYDAQRDFAYNQYGENAPYGAPQAQNFQAGCAAPCAPAPMMRPPVMRAPAPCAPAPMMRPPVMRPAPYAAAPCTPAMQPPVMRPPVMKQAAPCAPAPVPAPRPYAPAIRPPAPCAPAIGYTQAVQSGPIQPNYPQAPNAYAYGPQTPDAYAYGLGAAALANEDVRNSLGLRNQHDPHLYGNLGVTMFDTGADLYGIQGRAGYQGASIFGAEVEGAFGVGDGEQKYYNADDLAADRNLGFLTDLTSGLSDADAQTVVDAAASSDEVRARAQMDHQLAAFGVARMPVSEAFNVLARAGYHWTDYNLGLRGTDTNEDIDISSKGLAFGLGGEYNFNPLTALRADYTVYQQNNGLSDLNAVALAVARKF